MAPVRFNRAAARATWVCCALAATMSVSVGAYAEPLKLRVRGGARLEARATRGGGELVLSGTLRDDAGAPLPSQPVVISVTAEARDQAEAVAAALRSAHGCAEGGAAVVASPDGQRLRVTTRDNGTFCVRARLPLDRHRATLSWAGDPLLEAATLELPFDLSRRAVALRFDPPERVVSLDATPHRLEVAALIDEGEGAAAAPGLPITFTTEAGVTLGRAVTDRSGRARVSVDTKQLGPPGKGELRAAFAGDGDTAFASITAPIERRARVSLRVPALDKGLSPVNPEDGVPLDVELAAAGGPVGSGGVEAYVGETLVGAAPAEQGVAHVVMTFTAPAGDARVRVRYVSAAPWLEPGPEVAFSMPVRGPSPWSKVPLFLAAIGVVAWFVSARVRRREVVEPEREVEDMARASEGRARVEVLAPASRGKRGWAGAVVDAHEGTPIERARVWIERGGFEANEELASATTDARGVFALPPLEVRGGERLCAEARLHSRLTQDLPEQGRLAITLVSRRRQVLARLSAWARRQGKPFDAKPEATPAHVRRAAKSDGEVARWAEEVERAAYAEGEVDARKEEEIERLAPGPAEKPPPQADRH